MQLSWQARLNQNLTLKTPNPGRVAIIGVGNEFNGDDAAGVSVARLLSSQECAADAGHVLVLEAGQAPENVTVDLRSFHPDVVLLVDAAHLALPPGSIEWISWDSVTGMSAASHMLPLSMLARYLTLEFGCSVHLLGIQPAQNEPDSPPSPPVQAAIEQVAQELCRTLFQHT